VDNVPSSLLNVAAALQHPGRCAMPYWLWCLRHHLSRLMLSWARELVRGLRSFSYFAHSIFRPAPSTLADSTSGSFRSPLDCTATNMNRMIKRLWRMSATPTVEVEVTPTALCLVPDSAGSHRPPPASRCFESAGNSMLANSMPAFGILPSPTQLSFAFLGGELPGYP
jgi:hypothetical protein